MKDFITLIVFSDGIYECNWIFILIIMNVSVVHSKQVKYNYQKKKPWSVRVSYITVYGSFEVFILNC